MFAVPDRVAHARAATSFRMTASVPNTACSPARLIVQRDRTSEIVSPLAAPAIAIAH
jgi:hypothetical protein